MTSSILYNQCVQLGAVGGMAQKKVQSAAAVTVLHAQSCSALSPGFPLSQGNAEAPDK